VDGKIRRFDTEGRQGEDGQECPPHLGQDSPL
jgi:hypothetical protein